MTKTEAIKWLSNLKVDIGKTQHQELWHYEQAIDEIIQALEQEPKRGYWLEAKEEDPCWYRCSECGRLYDLDENYCPNCGARMEGNEE